MSNAARRRVPGGRRTGAVMRIRAEDKIKPLFNHHVHLAILGRANGYARAEILTQGYRMPFGGAGGRVFALTDDANHFGDPLLIVFSLHSHGRNQRDPGYRRQKNAR